MRLTMKYAFVNARVLDGRLDENGAMPIRPSAVLVNGSTIEAVISGPLPELTDYQVIDLEGKYLMPGLINLHVHLAASGKPPKANAKPVNYKALFDLLANKPLIMKGFLWMELELAKKHLYSGVTTIRTVGGVLDLDGQVRDRINRGKAEGPRILACNTAVSVPGGHFAGSLATEAVTAEDAVRDVENIAKTNPDAIKLMITGGVMDASAEGEPGVLRMKPELIRAACDKAHALGYRVAAHVESPEGVRAALENGVDTIEHGAAPDKYILELFQKLGAAHVCTISPALPYVLLPEEISHCGDLGRKNGRIVMDGIIECAKACLAAGIPVGMGTDAGCNFITPYDMWRELHYFTRYLGVTPDFALHTATQVNARILGLEQETGTVEAGKSADLLICSGNPLESFTAMRQPVMVMTRGKLIRSPKLRKRADVEKALNSIL